MITTIEGRLSEVGVDWVDVIVGGGVGLRVSVPTALIERVGVCLLYTSPSPRDRG